MVTVSKKQIIKLAMAFFLGAFWLFAIRFVTINKEEVHYHANFAVYVEGNRLPFDSFTYYEEIQTCFGGAEARPQSRVHMHDNVNHIVHVHDEAVTWGHFFANLGMNLGDKIFNYDKVIYIDDEDTNIEFYLNGREVETLANRVIGNEDVALVSIGNPSENELQEQFESIEKNAAEYNQRQDPSSCSGGKPFTTWERFKAALGFID
jgi:hypothetical protein